MSSPLSPYVEPQGDSIPMLLPVLVLIFFLICFFSIFLLRDLLHFLSYSRTRRRGNGDGGGGAQKEGEAGLDPAIISSFPTLPYSSARGILQEGKCGAAECAVCLGEFGGGDVVRLLTVCCHAFHPPCIDSWLASHATCPMCRSDLHAPPDQAAVLALRQAVDQEVSGAHSHIISVPEVDEDEPKSNSARVIVDEIT